MREASDDERRTDTARCQRRTRAVPGLDDPGRVCALRLPPVAPLGGIVGIVAIILAHVKRGEAAGTWLASHYRWLIRTFWFSVLWGLVGAAIFAILLIVLIGPVIAVLIWFVTTIWVIYRLIRGYVLFKDSKPVPGM